MEQKVKNDIEKALIKRAVGFDAEEVVEEFSSDEEGEARLLKRKVTTKNYPPDVSAAKLLLDMDSHEDLSAFDDEQLIKEKARLYAILKEFKENEDIV